MIIHPNYGILPMNLVRNKLYLCLFTWRDVRAVKSEKKKVQRTIFRITPFCKDGETTSHMYMNG